MKKLAAKWPIRMDILRPSKEGYCDFFTIKTRINRFAFGKYYCKTFSKKISNNETIFIYSGYYLCRGY